MIATLAGRTRRLAALATGMTLAATGAIALTGGSDAGASVTTDIAVSQSFSGSTTSGTTVDTVLIKNLGAANTSYVFLTFFLTTTSPTFTINATTGPSGEHCAVMPSPAGTTLTATCQITSVAAHSTATLKFNMAGVAGTKFTSLATVGGYALSDPNFANNKSTASSWYGPRADLVSTSSVVATSTAGTATVKENVRNAGPNNANGLQMIIEIKSAGFSSVVATGNVAGGSCQFIPPSTGNNAAVACVISSLATGKTWTESLAFKGTKGTSLQVVTSATANNPTDPNTANNHNTRTTTYHA
jgi:hypothetical protein